MLQSRKATRSDYSREIGASIRTLVVFTALATPAFWLRSEGFMPWTAGAATSGWAVAIWVIALLIAHDAWFYWTHRLMHSPRLFARWHRTHHRSVSPTPFAAYSFDWREAIVQALFSVLCIALLPMPMSALLMFLNVMIVRNAWGHCGVELHPAWFADHWLTRHFTTTFHHQLHHSGSYHHNFGLYFTWWDRLMGTEYPGYREAYRALTRRESGKQLEGVGDRSPVGGGIPL